MNLNIPHYRYERCYGLMADIKEIELIEFKTIKETPFGYWIQNGWLKKKFVLKHSSKRYAYPTKEEAFNSFKIRTIKSFHYASRDVENAKTFIDLINKHELNDKKIDLT
ncbi:MAG: hypothetical protein GY739_11850 [Mesoflavibacter sp.]|nr:hypothetical protein [Mesoflavibacter sp.]